MIVLRTPKGWTGPKEVDGKKGEGTWRAHQVPMAEMADKPEHISILEEWMESYRPEELFDENGRLRPELAELAPQGERRMSANPHANGGAAAARPAAARLPRLRRRRAAPGATHGRGHPRAWASSCATCMKLNLGARNFRLFSPDETNSNRWQDVLEVTDRCSMAEILPDGRPPRARRPGDGGAQRAPVPGLAGGLPADRPARLLLLLRGVHPHHRLDVQPARQVAEDDRSHIPWRRPIASLNYLLTSPRLAAGPQRLQPPGPGLHRPRRQQEGRGRPRLPAAGRQHACCR